MSEVMRWTLKGFLPGVEGMCKAVMRPEVVMASDFDAAQSELAALREELADCRFMLEANSKQVDRLIEEKSELRRDYDEILKHRSAQRDDAQQHLTAAEQRNATLTGLLERWYEANCNDLVHVEDGAYRIVLDTNEALTKPTESGASE